VKGTWDELAQVHALNDRQRKFSPLHRLYHLNVSSNSSLLENERVFDGLVKSLFTIGKVIESDELVVLYPNSLLTKTFGTWIQSQMAFLDTMTITEFKRCIREEAYCLNTCGLNHELGIERDLNTV